MELEGRTEEGIVSFMHTRGAYVVSRKLETLEILYSLHFFITVRGSVYTRERERENGFRR